MKRSISPWMRQTVSADGGEVCRETTIVTKVFAASAQMLPWMPSGCGDNTNAQNSVASPTARPASTPDFVKILRLGKQTPQIPGAS